MSHCTWVPLIKIKCGCTAFNVACSCFFQSIDCWSIVCVCARVDHQSNLWSSLDILCNVPPPNTASLSSLVSILQLNYEPIFLLSPFLCYGLHKILVYITFHFIQWQNTIHAQAYSGQNGVSKDSFFSGFIKRGVSISLCYILRLIFRVGLLFEPVRVALDWTKLITSIVSNP